MVLRCVMVKLMGSYRLLTAETCSVGIWAGPVTAGSVPVW